MTTAYWCVLVAALLPYIATSIAKAGGERYNNRQPRLWLDRQQGFRARADAAYVKFFRTSRIDRTELLVCHGNAGNISAYWRGFREYRDAVGRRTREIISGFGPGDWDGAVKADAVERAAAAGAFGARTEALSKGFPGRPRSAVLSGIALFHSAGHMGEGVTVRSAGGFGTGI